MEWLLIKTLMTYVLHFFIIWLYLLPTSEGRSLSGLNLRLRQKMKFAVQHCSGYLNKMLKLTQCVAGEKTLPCAASSHRAHTEYISGCSVLVFLSLLDKLGRLTKFYCSYVFAQFLTSKKQWHVTEWARNIYRLDGWKGAFFQVQGPVQGPREEVQGPCARATIPINRNGCKGHLDMCKGHKKRCKGLWCVQGPHIMSLYQNTNLVQGPHLLPFKVLEHT